ncbi:hypothetical protein BC834DRAFT_101701 [Gloeopeniophorella convolvens]|nr:hypothetical protein BC834DRAFT_101701 [Gloeopeniophorella convolvens]
MLGTQCLASALSRSQPDRTIVSYRDHFRRLPRQELRPIRGIKERPVHRRTLLWSAPLLVGARVGMVQREHYRASKLLRRGQCWGLTGGGGEQVILTDIFLYLKILSSRTGKRNRASRLFFIIGPVQWKDVVSGLACRNPLSIEAARWAFSISVFWVPSMSAPLTFAGD